MTVLIGNLFCITMFYMRYEVKIRKQVLKDYLKMSKKAQKVFKQLVMDLELSGPVQPSYPNYSKLGSLKYHCHLDYKWVACWKMEKEIIIEVYYAGSREKAPY